MQKQIFLFFDVGVKSVVVVVAFSNDSVFGVSIENDAFSDVSVFKSLHFEQRFRMTSVWHQKLPFSSLLLGNQNQKQIDSTPSSFS